MEGQDRFRPGRQFRLGLPADDDGADCLWRQGWSKYGDIAKNFVFTDSSGSVPRYVADGETPLGLTLEDNALEYKVGGAPVKIAYLEDGTTASPDGVALVKGAPNAENGKKFIDWALSKKTQELLVKEAGRRSVRTDVSGPGDLPPLSSLKLIELKSIDELGGTPIHPRQVAQSRRPMEIHSGRVPLREQHLASESLHDCCRPPGTLQCAAGSTPAGHRRGDGTAGDISM